MCLLFILYTYKTIKEHAVLPSTSQRVPSHTCRKVNEQIRRETQQGVERFRGASRESIDQRLEELDQEWDTERTLETNAATLAFTGCILATTMNSRCVYLPMVVTGFLLQHALQGWCPPLPVSRLVVRICSANQRPCYIRRVSRRPAGGPARDDRVHA